MDLSNRGLQAIVQREGVFLKAYRDTVGVWTIGTGHTTAAGPPRVTPGMVITKQQNDEILRADLKPIIEQANKYVKVPITQNQFDALVSIVFNVGPSFWRSTAIRKLNSGDIQGAAQAIMQWSKPPEIIGRRRSEQKQFLTPDPASPHLPAVSATAVAGGAATGFSYYWHEALHFLPYIAGGAVAVGVATWLGIFFYNRAKQNVSSTSG